MTAQTQKKLILLLFALSTAIMAPIIVLQLSKRQATTVNAAAVTVLPAGETDSFQTGSGDVADDSAIWVNTANPGQSVIIADNKDTSNGGIGVFGLDGKQIQFRPDGFVGNVDLRSNFQFGSRSIVLVGANHRGNSTILLYELNPSSRQLTPIPGSRSTGSANYGFCFYQNRQTGKTYAIVLHENGTLQQHELVVSGTSINTTVPKSLDVGGQSEGCVADDELGQLYVAEEDLGVWKYNAQTPDNATRTRVDSTANGGVFTNDLEGMTLAYGANGTGYVFVSRQNGSSTEYAVYQRAGDNQFVKTFKIGSSGSVDAVSDTDGIDAINANLGSAYPKGIFIAHDASNDGRTSNVASNLKFVPLDRIVDMAGTITNPPLPNNPPPTIGTTTSPIILNPSIPFEPGTTSFFFNLLLHGIGKAGDNTSPGTNGNLNPVTPVRQLTVEIYNTNNALVRSVTGNIAYDATTGSFRGAINGGQLSAGAYQLRIHTPKYLWKRYTQVFQVTSSQPLVTVPLSALVVGDIDNNNKVETADLNLILECFSDLAPPKPTCTSAKKAASDITDDNNVNQFDYNLFLREISVQCGSNCDPTPTSGAGVTATTIPTVSNIPTTNPSLSAPPPPGSGIWISQTEIMKLPTSGAAWDSVNAAANSNWGSACLYDNNCMHDVNTLAGALVAVRTNNSAMRAKTIAGLQAATKSNLSRALELSRGLQTYIIAADIIGYQDAGFKTWVRSMLTTNVQGHGGTGVLGTAYNSANNWGGHARASVAAAAIYLNDATLKQNIVKAHNAFIGVAPSSSMVYTDTTWHASSSKAGVNRKGSAIQGKSVSGVLPEDWRRASDYKWPPDQTGYMWEGMQGYVVTAVILHRANLVPFIAGDNAVVRSMNMLYGTGEAAVNSPVYKNPPTGDDTWIPWVVNKYAGTNFATQATSPGKNMGWTDWTHAK